MRISDWSSDVCSSDLLGLMSTEHEPSLARSLASDALETDRANIVDRNGVVLATTMPTASLYANPQHVRDPETAAARLAEVLPGLSPAALRPTPPSARSLAWPPPHLTPPPEHRGNAP